MKPWNAAVYIRTSKGVEEDPGNTLGVQLGIIMDYLNKVEDIELCTIKIDNGRTGLNFNRPAFREMMDEVEAGLVNCIIVKDLSRFSRNHLDASDMLFREFATKNIRFIAVQDDIDLLYLREEQRDFFIPFRTFMNQMYSMDLSKKFPASSKSNGIAVSTLAAARYTVTNVTLRTGISSLWTSTQRKLSRISSNGGWRV